MTLLLIVVCAVLAVQLHRLYLLRELCGELRVIETKCVATAAQAEVDAQNEVVERIRQSLGGG